MLFLGLAVAALGGLVGVIVALRRSLARERALARTDDVTGVRNARAFREVAAAEIARARRYQHPFTVVCVDLGNRVGDGVLRAAAVGLRAALRATDLIARLGRDEFIVLMPETPATAGHLVLDKLRAGLADLRAAGDRPLSTRIGGVTFLDPPRGVDDIIRATDERIADAKATGVPSHGTWNAVPGER
jgi:diguanylate cyclase (GGDEF)-like protein